MPKVNVTIVYGAETNNAIERMYEFNKVFRVKRIPNIECYLILNDVMIPEIWFSKPKYDPETDTYYIRNVSSVGLERYEHSHHRRFFIALSNSIKFEKAGWTSSRIENEDSFNPFCRTWDISHFKQMEKCYNPSDIVQKLLDNINQHGDINRNKKEV